MISLRALLWVDCCAGAAFGSLVLVLTAIGISNSITGLPNGLLVVVGSANLAYAAYSFSIVVRARHSARSVRFLVLANGVWSLVCVSMASAFLGNATLIGMSCLVGEAVFVACLAWLEWRALGIHGAPT